MTESQVYLDGSFVGSANARIRCDDAGFQVGDGLFETLRVDGCRAVDAEAHLDRLYDGLARIRLAIPESRAELGAAIEAVASASPEPVARLRVTVTRGGPGGDPTRLVAAAPYEPPAAGAYDGGVLVVVVRELPVDERDPLRQLKSTSWQRQSMALAMAQEQGAFEGILLNGKGEVAEGTRSNVVARIGDRIVTPAVEDGCLPGTVRRRLVESGLVGQGRLRECDLVGTDELVLTNSLIGVLPVGCVEGEQRRVGDLAKRLRAALASFGWSWCP